MYGQCCARFAIVDCLALPVLYQCLIHYIHRVFYSSLIIFIKLTFNI